MSQLLVEPELVNQLFVKQELQLKPSQILRQTTMIQHFGSYGDYDNVCALGAIARFLGWDGTYTDARNTPTEFINVAIPDICIRGRVSRLNDDDHKSFAEIADWLESRGY